jgi:Ca2+-binding RTX toxin-like protein
MRRTIVLLATMALTLLVASGVALAVTKIGTNGPDTLRGTNGADNLLGNGANDVLFALGGRDNLLGGEGKDWVLGENDGRPSGGEKTLLGGPGNDGVLGGRGSDNVLGEKGDDFVADGPDREFATDRLSAGDGNDAVGVFNDPAFKDLVTCGDGLDRVFADRKDVIASDCEKVADSGPERERLGRALERSGFFERLAPPLNSG